MCRPLWGLVGLPPPPVGPSLPFLSFFTHKHSRHTPLLGAETMDFKCQHSTGPDSKDLPSRTGGEPALYGLRPLHFLLSTLERYYFHVWKQRPREQSNRSYLGHTAGVWQRLDSNTHLWALTPSHHHPTFPISSSGPPLAAGSAQHPHCGLTPLALKPATLPGNLLVPSMALRCVLFKSVLY